MSSGSINIADILESHAAIIGDRIAVITDDCIYTYGEINHRANKLANHLLACGFKAGDHIAIHSRNRIEWIDAFYACLKIRAVPININYRYTKNELKYLYNDSDARGVIVSQEFYNDIASIYSELPKLRWVGTIETMYENAVRHVKATQGFEKRSGDDLYITYTGGTTGMPKGVMWRQEDLIYAAMNKARGDLPIESALQISLEALDRPNQTRIMCNSPMMHASGQWMMGSALMIGAIFVLYTQKSFTGPECLALAEKAEANSMNVIGDDSYLFNPDRECRGTRLEFGFGPHFCIAYRAIKSHLFFYIDKLLEIKNNFNIDYVVYDKESKVLGSPIKEIHGTFYK